MHQEGEEHGHGQKGVRRQLHFPPPSSRRPPLPPSLPLSALLPLRYLVPVHIHVQRILFLLIVIVAGSAAPAIDVRPRPVVKGGQTKGRWVFIGTGKWNPQNAYNARTAPCRAVPAPPPWPPARPSSSDPRASEGPAPPAGPRTPSETAPCPHCRQVCVCVGGYN